VDRRYRWGLTGAPVYDIVAWRRTLRAPSASSVGRRTEQFSRRGVSRFERLSATGVRAMATSNLVLLAVVPVALLLLGCGETMIDASKDAHDPSSLTEPTRHQFVGDGIEAPAAALQM